MPRSWRHSSISQLVRPCESFGTAHFDQGPHNFSRAVYGSMPTPPVQCSIYEDVNCCVQPDTARTLASNSCESPPPWSSVPVLKRHTRLKWLTAAAMCTKVRPGYAFVKAMHASGPCGLTYVSMSTTPAGAASDSPCSSSSVIDFSEASFESADEAGAALPHLFWLEVGPCRGWCVVAHLRCACLRSMTPRYQPSDNRGCCCFHRPRTRPRLAT